MSEQYSTGVHGNFYIYLRRYVIIIRQVGLIAVHPLMAARFSVPVKVCYGYIKPIVKTVPSLR